MLSEIHLAKHIPKHTNTGGAVVGGCGVDVQLESKARPSLNLDWLCNRDLINIRVRHWKPLLELRTEQLPTLVHCCAVHCCAAPLLGVDQAWLVSCLSLFTWQSGQADTTNHWSD